MNFLLSNQIFSDCNKSEFFNSYFNLFAKTKIYIHQKIITEDTDHNTIYFIKTGEYLVTTNKSLIEIEKLIESFGIKIEYELKYHELIHTSPEFYKFMNLRNYLKVTLQVI